MKAAADSAEDWAAVGWAVEDSAEAARVEEVSAAGSAVARLVANDSEIAATAAAGRALGLERWAGWRRRGRWRRWWRPHKKRTNSILLQPTLPAGVLALMSTCAPDKN